MNQRLKRIQNIGSTAGLTPRQHEILESLYMTPEILRQRKKLITICASDSDSKEIEGIIKKLLPGHDPDQVHVNVVLSKHDQQL